VMMSFTSFSSEKLIILCLFSASLLPPAHPLSLHYTSLILWTLYYVILTYADPSASTCRISCLSSIAYVIPKNKSKSETF